ncbi:MAG: TIGR02444 family protein [Spongiibacteraceae bacterium]
MTETLLEFALASYRREGVAECCLRLQDGIDADVNMLLTAAWLVEQHRCWHRDDVRALIEHCQEWRERCVIPLRAIRRYLQGHALYEALKANELSAEIHQLHLLQDKLQSLSLQRVVGANADLLSANLQTYIEYIHPHRVASVDEDLCQLIARLRR